MPCHYYHCSPWQKERSILVSFEALGEQCLHSSMSSSAKVPAWNQNQSWRQNAGTLWCIHNQSSHLPTYGQTHWSLLHFLCNLCKPWMCRQSKQRGAWGWCALTNRAYQICVPSSTILAHSVVLVNMTTAVMVQFAACWLCYFQSLQGWLCVWCASCRHGVIVLHRMSSVTHVPAW